MYICNIYILFESFDQDVFVVTSIFISYKSYKFKFENGTMLFVSFFFHHLLKSYMCPIILIFITTGLPSSSLHFLLYIQIPQSGNLILSNTNFKSSHQLHLNILILYHRLKQFETKEMIYLV